MLVFSETLERCWVFNGSAMWVATRIRCSSDGFVFVLVWGEPDWGSVEKIMDGVEGVVDLVGEEGDDGEDDGDDREVGLLGDLFWGGRVSVFA